MSESHVPTRLFHGSSDDKTVLTAGTFVTKRFKDACKFGYRRAAQSGAEFVYVHRIAGDVKTTPDPNRDGSFILAEDAMVMDTEKISTFDVPFKLRKWKLDE